MKLGNNKEKFGYYKVGDFTTFSKVEAIELSRGTGHFPQWVFNDLEFSCYDWQTEPQATLKQLYARRAQQIRENYDYVVLFYSGGADSSNILDTFIENSVPFDEIATFNYWAVDSDPTSYFNAEQVQVSYPRIKYLQDSGVKFFHRFIDLSSIAKQVLTNNDYRLSRSYWSNSHWGTSLLCKSFIRESVPAYQKLIEQGKKLVFVWGCDKPRLFQENGRYCIKFQDITDTCIATRTQIVNREWEYDEFFYWAPEAADIICKQGHVLMDFFRRSRLSPDGDHRRNDLIDHPEVNKIFGERHAAATHRNIINQLIYPNFDMKTFSAGKHPRLINNWNDRVFLSSPHWRTHVNLLTDHLKQLDPYWHNDSNNIELGLLGQVSPSYYLE